MDPLGEYCRSTKVCLYIEDFDEDDPCILNHPDDLLEALEELSESHSIDYPVAACPNTLEFIESDDEYELDPIWSGSWYNLTMSSDILLSGSDSDCDSIDCFSVSTESDYGSESGSETEILDI